MARSDHRFLDYAIALEEIVGTVRSSRVRVRGERIQAWQKEPWLDDIIGVEEKHRSRIDVRKAGVSRRSGSTPYLALNVRGRIQPARHLGAAIGGTVVDDDDTQAHARMVLRQ